MSTVFSNSQIQNRPQSLTPRQTLEKICNYLLPFLLLWAYVGATAGVYYMVERNCEMIYFCPTTYLVIENKEQEADVGQNLDLISDSTFPTSLKPPRETTQFRRENYTALRSWENLTYWGAFHFIAISVTTIGYGDVYPCTETGQALTIVFSLIGIPITLIALTRMGKLFSFLLHKLWVKIYCFYTKPPYEEKQLRLMHNRYYVPMFFGLTVAGSWILLASVYFYFTVQTNSDSHRKFTYFTAFYFTVISFLTIGYGDYSPRRYGMIVPTFTFLLVGLSLVTMCIEIVRTQFELMFEEMVLMIEEEFQNQIDDDDKTMCHDKTAAVKDVMTKVKESSLSKKLLMPFMSKNHQQELVNIYDTKSKLISHEIQTTSVEINHREIQVDVYDQESGNNNNSTIQYEERKTRNVGCQVKFKPRKPQSAIVAGLIVLPEKIEPDNVHKLLFRKVAPKPM